MSISPLNKSSILYENMIKNHFFSPFFIQSLIASKQNTIQQGLIGVVFLISKFTCFSSFSSLESNLSEDEESNDQNDKHRRTRTNFTSSQIDELEKAFQEG